MQNFKLLPILLFFLAFQVKAQTVSDVDGNTYNTVTIGTQIWMKENLKTTKYNDGTAIPNVTNGSSWVALTTPAYCWYDNDMATYKATRGALYNWFTVNTDKLCPTGWQVPSEGEWSTLISFLGGESVAGGKLKATGLTYWESPNTGADNSSGFTGLPGGYLKAIGGYFAGITSGGYWWSKTKIDATTAHKRAVAANEIFTLDYGSQMETGLSVRCLKDTNSVDQITVTFNMDGGSSVPILSVSKNTTITKPTDPTKTGYTFSGWYKEAACTNAWDFATDIVTTNITLFAKWTTITFVENKQVADFKIYPNPAKDKLYINFNPPNTSGTIFDLQGKRVMEIMSGATQIDISNLSKGVYLVKIITSGNIFVDKLIKE